MRQVVDVNISWPPPHSVTDMVSWGVEMELGLLKVVMQDRGGKNKT